MILINDKSLLHITTFLLGHDRCLGSVYFSEMFVSLLRFTRDERGGR